MRISPTPTSPSRPVPEDPPANGAGSAADTLTQVTNGTEVPAPPAPHTYRRVLLQVAVSVGLLAASIVGVVALFASRTPPRRTAIDAPIPQVETGKVALWPGLVEFEVDGVVVPFREINIAAQASGRVTALGHNLRVGSSVRRGDTLVKIDPRDHKLETQQLTSELDRDQLAIKEVEGELARNRNETKIAREDLTIRQRQLDRYRAGIDRGAFSDSAIDQAQLDEITARRTLQGLQDQARILEAKKQRLGSLLAIAETRLSTAELKLARTTITSPVDGVVTQIHVEADGYAAAGATVITVQDTSRMEVQCKLQARQMQWIWEQSRSGPGDQEGSPSSFQFPSVSARVVYSFAGAERTWTGRLARFDGAGFDTTTRMIPVKVVVDEPHVEPGAGAGPTDLLRGMFVHVRFEVPVERQLLQVPSDAVTADGRVWLVQDGALLSAAVDVLWNRRGSVVVSDPNGILSAESVVVTSPVAYPIEGMAVAVAQEGVK